MIIFIILSCRSILGKYADFVLQIFNSIFTKRIFIIMVFDSSYPSKDLKTKCGVRMIFFIIIPTASMWPSSAFDWKICTIIVISIVSFFGILSHYFLFQLDSACPIKFTWIYNNSFILQTYF